jgi:hypothetical protein
VAATWAVSFALAALVLPIGCTSRPPDGNRFRPQSPPAADQALVYIYRYDSLRGVGAMQVEVAGESLGGLGNGQYMALILRPEPHRISLRLKRFGFLPASWTHVELELEPGSTVYLHSWAAYSELDTGPESRSLELPGRANRQASVGIFAIRRPEREALEQLSTTYQVKVVQRRR